MYCMIFENSHIFLNFVSKLGCRGASEASISALPRFLETMVRKAVLERANVLRLGENAKQGGK